MGEPALPEDGRSARGSRELSVPYFDEAGIAMTPDDRGLRVSGVGDADGERVGRSARPGAGAAGVSVRLRRRRGAGAMPRVRDEMTRDGARAVVRALAEELAAAPRLDRERFRAVGEPGQGADRAEGRRRCFIRSASR